MCANVRSDLKSDDTVELLRRARAGEHDALERLFDHHVPILRRWASGRMPRWARNADDTWDVVQETVVQTLKHIDTFEPRGVGALQAYLRRAVINRGHSCRSCLPTSRTTTRRHWTRSSGSRPRSDTTRAWPLWTHSNAMRCSDASSSG